MNTKTHQQKADETYMREALALAAKAAGENEIPVGAVVVVDQQIAGIGYNRSVKDCDPSAHAEVIALRDAAKRVGNHRLLGATLYVTLEPCLMCCGCLVHARINRLVFGAREPRTGAVISVNAVLAEPNALHHVSVNEGVLVQESQDLLQAFFQQRRDN